MSTGAQRLKFGAPEETRTPKIWFLRPTRIPIPSPGRKYNMQSKQDSIKKIERLLAMETLGKTFVTKQQQLAYERGYLTGLVATLAYNDNSIESVVNQRIKHLTPKI